MKITQEPKFQPITIVLETKEEAQVLWDAILAYEAPTHSENRAMNKLSNWFSNEAQL